MKIKLKNYVLTYHPRKNSWSAKVVKKKPSKLGRGSSYVTKSKNAEQAWKKLSRRSYYGETRRRLK